MSNAKSAARLTVPEITARKGGNKIVALTAYTTPVARLLDPHVDILLVDDTVGMVLHELPSTVGVTMEMMFLHGRAVMRGSSRALVAVDIRSGRVHPNLLFANGRFGRAIRPLECLKVAGWSLWAPGPTANECSTRCRRTRMAAIERPNLRTQHDDLRSPFPARGNIASKVILRNMK